MPEQFVGIWRSTNANEVLTMIEDSNLMDNGTYISWLSINGSKLSCSLCLTGSWKIVDDNILIKMPQSYSYILAGQTGWIKQRILSVSHNVFITLVPDDEITNIEYRIQTQGGIIH